MASRIQGITVEIGGDTTKLSSALSGVNKEIKNTQTQLKDVDKLDNLQGQITILKSTLEGIAIQIGEILMPTVRKIVAKIQEWATAFSNLDEGTKETIVKIAAVVAAIGPLLVILGTVISPKQVRRSRALYPLPVAWQASSRR